MPEKVKRPIIIYITQVMLCVVTAIMLTGVIAATQDLLTKKLPRNAHTIVTSAAVVVLLMVVASLIAFWDLLNRRKSGKWLASASLLVVWLVVVVAIMMPYRTGLYGPYYASLDERTHLLASLSWFHVIILAPVAGLWLSRSVDQFLDNPAKRR